MGIDLNAYECKDICQIPNKIHLNNNTYIKYFIYLNYIVIYIYLIFLNISYILLLLHSFWYFQGIYKLCIQRLQLAINK